MVFFLTVGALFAAYLVAQSVHILTSGDLRAFFVAGSREARSRLALRNRIAPGLLHLVPGAAILALLAVVILRLRSEILQQLLSHGAAFPIGGVFLAVYGLVVAARPDIIMRSLARAYPGQINEGDVTLARMVRLISAGVSVFGFYLLSCI